MQTDELDDGMWCKKNGWEGERSGEGVHRKDAPGEAGFGQLIVKAGGQCGLLTLDILGALSSRRPVKCGSAEVVRILFELHSRYEFVFVATEPFSGLFSTVVKLQKPGVISRVMGAPKLHSAHWVSTLRCCSV